ncbi:hypothetical protein STEG23_023390 [Scotinomys teguina]
MNKTDSVSKDARYIHMFSKCLEWHLMGPFTLENTLTKQEVPTSCQWFLAEPTNAHFRVHTVKKKKKEEEEERRKKEEEEEEEEEN